MRDTRLAAAAVLTVAWLSGCAHGGPAIVATFDVQQLPPEPPAEPAAEQAVVVPPPTAPTPPPPPPRPVSPEEALRPFNERLQVVLFETGQWKITEDGRRSIEQDLSVMRGAPGWVATVEGHADERGTDEWNQALGMYRAKAVKDTLRDLGLEPSQLTIVSYGKTRPISKGRDPESLAVNRRVEIVLHPVPASGRR